MHKLESRVAEMLENERKRINADVDSKLAPAISLATDAHQQTGALSNSIHSVESAVKNIEDSLSKQELATKTVSAELQALRDEFRTSQLHAVEVAHREVPEERGLNETGTGTDAANGTTENNGKTTTRGPDATVRDPGAHTAPSQATNQPAAEPGSQTGSIDLLIVTDSIGRGLIANRLYRNKSVSVQKLRQGRNIQEAKEYLENTDTDPRHVVIQVGTNDLVNKDVPIVRHELKELLQDTRAKFPTASVLFSQILPRIGNADFNNKAWQLNSAIKAACDTKGIHFIPHARLWGMATRARHFVGDGIHLTTSGIGVLVQDYKLVLNPLMGIPVIPRGLLHRNPPGRNPDPGREKLRVKRVCTLRVPETGRE